MFSRRCLRFARLLRAISPPSGRTYSVSRPPRTELVRSCQTVTPFSSQVSATSAELSSAEYEKIVDVTLESLNEFFEIFLEGAVELRGSDVTYGDGVLTVKLGPHGTYVVNRQSPNRQIWLSSPRSGPKRYDFVKKVNGWVYKRDEVSLHELLSREISDIVGRPVDLKKCQYAGSWKDLRECYSQLHQLNSDLLRSYSLRSANHNEIISTLRSINSYIQQASRLRVGRDKNEIAQHCKLAVAHNNINALIKIIKTGEV